MSFSLTPGSCDHADKRCRDVTMSNILSALPAILTPLLNFRCEGILEVAIHQHPTVKLPSATLGDTKDGPSVSSEADSTKASCAPLAPQAH